MKSLSELLNRSIKPAAPDRRKGRVTTLSGPIPLGGKTARHAIYEGEVFNFLWSHKDILDIRSVAKFANLLVDGQVVLGDGRRLVIEVKLRMNWLKACQSEWQLRQFLSRYSKEAGLDPVDGAMVFFEAFSGDWSKKRSGARNVWGWEAWYLYYRDAIDGKPVDLLMLCNDELQGYPV
jgi:hypothetical protein